MANPESPWFKATEEHPESEKEKKEYANMVFEDLAADPDAGPVLEQKALEYLMTKDAEYFNREFTGELDQEGYLISKNGSNSNTKPSMNIGNAGMEQVATTTKEALLQQQNPDFVVDSNEEVRPSENYEKTDLDASK